MTAKEATHVLRLSSHHFSGRVDLVRLKYTHKDNRLEVRNNRKLLKECKQRHWVQKNIDDERKMINKGLST